MRRFLPAFLLALAVVSTGPFVLAGCDMIAKMKGGGADAGFDAASLIAAANVDAAVPATPTVPGTATVTAPATLTPTPTPTPVHPVVGDAGLHADAGPRADAGHVPPVPTPFPTIPPNLFDAGAFRFDAGGFKPPWQH